MPEYRWRRYGDVEMLAVPTPGHTPGSVSYVADVDGSRVAFTGDLIAAPGKVHSLASTQWAYNGLNGVVTTILSGLDVLDLDPAVLLPAHGEKIEDPKAAIHLLNARLQALINTRMPEWQIADLRSDPFVEITPHLLWNATGLANSYALLSDDGVALLIDYGYDFGPYLPPFEQMITTHRSSRRALAGDDPGFEARARDRSGRGRSCRATTTTITSRGSTCCGRSKAHRSGARRT